MREVGETQVQIGERETGRTTFASAIIDALKIEEKRYCALALRDIAYVQKSNGMGVLSMAFTPDRRDLTMREAIEFNEDDLYKDRSSR